VIDKSAFAVDPGNGLYTQGPTDEVGGKTPARGEFLAGGPQHDGERFQIRGGMIDAMESAVAAQDQQRARAFQEGKGIAADPVVDPFGCREPVRDRSSARAPDPFESLLQGRPILDGLDHAICSMLAPKPPRSIFPLGLRGSSFIW